MGNLRTMLIEATTNISELEFLFYDNVVAAGVNRMLIFGLERALTYLGNLTTWHMDRNFSMAPTIFKQLHLLYHVFTHFYQERRKNYIWKC